MEKIMSDVVFSMSYVVFAVSAHSLFAKCGGVLFALSAFAYACQSIAFKASSSCCLGTPPTMVLASFPSLK